MTFLVYLGLQWWASWYPGAEPGGGGSSRSRYFSARDERHGLLGAVVQRRALRDSAVALDPHGAGTIVLYPGLEKPETASLLV